MDRAEATNAVINNLEAIVASCHRCPSEAVRDMLEAVDMLEESVSRVSGKGRPALPEDGGDVSKMCYLLRDVIGKVREIPDSADPLVLDGLLGVTREMRGALSV